MKDDEGDWIPRALMRRSDDTRMLNGHRRGFSGHAIAVMGTISPAAGGKACIIPKPEREQRRGQWEGEDRQ
jgi:hypothetical protein